MLFRFRISFRTHFRLLHLPDSILLHRHSASVPQSCQLFPSQERMSNLTLHIFFHRTPEQRLLPHLQNFSSLMHNICHIMGNHQDCNLFFLIQFPDQLVKVQNRRRIESRDRLIENQQLIRRTERPRDQNTLFLTAGKLSETAFSRSRIPRRSRFARASFFSFIE